MKITIRETAEKIKSSRNILVTAHINPDGDAIGSTLAMLHMLESMNKNVRAYIDDKLPKNFSVLPRENEIRRPEPGEKFDADLLIVLDTSPDRIGRVRELTDAPILNIDHHVTNHNDEGDLYLEQTAAATCEIIYKLGLELRIKFNKDIAFCLYTGLATDTGFFNYSNTKPATFRVAADLVELGVCPNEIAEQVEKRTLRDVKTMCVALGTTKLFYGGKVAGMFIDEEFAKKVETTEGLIDLIRVIDSVDVAFLLTCKEKNFCRVSMRSKAVNVSDIAQKLGGGGHIRAAGCSLKNGYDEAKNTVIRSIGEGMVAQGFLSQKDFEEDRELALVDYAIEF